MFDHVHQRVGQKRQSPPGAARGWIRASQSNELYLFLAIQLSSSPRPWFFTEGGLQADFYKAFFGAVDGRAAGLHRCLDLLVADASVRGQQDLHSLEPPDWLFAATH
ncbi:hypothetical protein D3C71_1868870 [compost metagenome]